MALYTFQNGRLVTAQQLNDSFLSRVPNTGEASLADCTLVRLKDSVTLFQNAIDATKRMRVGLEQISTGQTRVLSMVDEDVTVVGVENDQTITGDKTFDGETTFNGAATFNGPVNFENQDSILPVGTMLLYGDSSAPDGFLRCDGAAVSRGVYSKLFAVIQTNYGVGNGTTTFNLPNFLGRVPVGYGLGSGLTEREIGDSFGAETHELTADENGPHTHDVPQGGGNARADGNTPGGGLAQRGQQTTSVSGLGDPHNNMQPSLVVNYIIKY